MTHRLLVSVSLSAVMLSSVGGGLAFAHHSATATYIQGKSVKIDGTLKGSDALADYPFTSMRFPYYPNGNYMGLVNDRKQPDYYDGRVRVVDPRGRETALFFPAEYLDQVAEHGLDG